MSAPDDKPPSPWTISPSSPEVPTSPVATSSGATAPSAPAPTGLDAAIEAFSVRDPTPAPPSPPDEPILPPAGAALDLRDAAGVGPAKPTSRTKSRAPTAADDDSDSDEPAAPRPRRSRRATVVGAIALVLGIGIAALIFLGRANSERLVLSCESERVVAERGRAFPPWGERPLDTAEFKPIKIPPEAECRARETTDVRELSDWFATMLVSQATLSLTVSPPTKLDDAEAQLRQALLLTRDPDRRDQRKDIERLLGDVAYWRALAKLRDAGTALTDAAKDLDAAAAQRPRHVSDASAWATHARTLADSLRAGPNGAGSASPLLAPAPPDRPAAPVGTALPVEPATAPPPDAPPPAPDAGMPTGGVLL